MKKLIIYAILVIVPLFCFFFVFILFEYAGGDTENYYAASINHTDGELTYEALSPEEKKFNKNVEKIWDNILYDAFGNLKYMDFNQDPLQIDIVLPYLTAERIAILSPLNGFQLGDVQIKEWNLANKFFFTRTLPELISDRKEKIVIVKSEPIEGVCKEGSVLTDENICEEEIIIYYYEIDYGKYLDFIYKKYFVDARDIKELWVDALAIKGMFGGGNIYVKLMSPSGSVQDELELERYVYCTLPAEFPVHAGNVEYTKAAAVAIRSYVLAAGKNPKFEVIAGQEVVTIEITNSSQNQNTNCYVADKVGSETKNKINTAIKETEGEVMYINTSIGQVLATEYSRCGAYLNKVKNSDKKVRSYCDAPSLAAITSLTGYVNGGAKDCVSSRPDFISACGHSRGMSQVGDLYVALVLEYKYDQILRYHYNGTLGNTSSWIMGVTK